MTRINETALGVAPPQQTLDNASMATLGPDLRSPCLTAALMADDPVRGARAVARTCGLWRRLMDPNGGRSRGVPSNALPEGYFRE